MNNNVNAKNNFNNMNQNDKQKNLLATVAPQSFKRNLDMNFSNPNNYSLEPEKDEEKIVNWILKARFKKKTLTEEEFDNWLKEEEKRLF